MSDRSIDTSSAPAPHGGCPVRVSGPAAAEGAVIYLHGRGATAESILSLAPQLTPPGWLSIAPQASAAANSAHPQSWYPMSFLAPGDVNTAAVASAHAVIEAILAQLAGRGITSERVALVGFSQGACLASDHVYRHPRRYRALVAFTGGLVGPAGHAFPPLGSLDGTPVLLAANDPDSHVPWTRVEETADVLAAMGARVDCRRYPNRPHAVQPESIAPARTLLVQL